MTGKLVVNAVLDAHPWASRRLPAAPLRTSCRYLVGVLRPGDLCLTLGAGDLTLLPDELQPRLAGNTAASASMPHRDLDAADAAFADSVLAGASSTIDRSGR